MEYLPQMYSIDKTTIKTKSNLVAYAIVKYKEKTGKVPNVVEINKNWKGDLVYDGVEVREVSYIPQNCVRVFIEEK